MEYRIDKQALRLMRRTGIPVLPMLTNNYNSDFHPEAIGRIMRDAKKRMALINEMVGTCRRYRFAGINLDLEELNIQDNDLLVELLKDFSRVFHANGFM